MLAEVLSIFLVKIASRSICYARLSLNSLGKGITPNTSLGPLVVLLVALSCSSLTAWKRWCYNRLLRIFLWFASQKSADPGDFSLKIFSRSIMRQDILNLPVARMETADIQRRRFCTDYHETDVCYDIDEKRGEIGASIVQMVVSR